MMKEKILIGSKTLNELFRAWRKLTHSQILSVDQRNNRFSFEFVVDQSAPANKLLQKLTEQTVKKHPPGTVSFVSYYSSEKVPISTLYRQYRIDFIDPSNKSDAIDEEKLRFFISELVNILKSQ